MDANRQYWRFAFFVCKSPTPLRRVGPRQFGSYFIRQANSSISCSLNEMMRAMDTKPARDGSSLKRMLRPRDRPRRHQSSVPTLACVCRIIFGCILFDSPLSSQNDLLQSAVNSLYIKLLKARLDHLRHAISRIAFHSELQGD